MKNTSKVCESWAGFFLIVWLCASIKYQPSISEVLRNNLTDMLFYLQKIAFTIIASVKLSEAVLHAQLLFYFAE